MAPVKIEPCIPEDLPLQELDWGALVPWIGPAREALGRYDEVLRTISPQTLRRLQWEETISSLRGQNIQTDLKEVLPFAKRRVSDEARAPFLQKIVNAQKGLELATSWVKSKPLNTSFFCRVHAFVKKDGPNPEEIGQIRKKQNWLGPEGGPIEEAYFFPPSANQVNAYLSALNRYFRTREKDPLVQIAIFFAQFLLIHPFMDGNGRVARIFIPIGAYKKKLLCKPALFLSSYFEDHRLAYFQKLFHISEHTAWEEWIIYFFKGVIYQCQKLQDFAASSTSL